MTAPLTPLQIRRRQFQAERAARAYANKPWDMSHRRFQEELTAKLKQDSIAALRARYEKTGTWAHDRDFRSQAKCAGMDTDTFFPERGSWKTNKVIYDICVDCPVRLDCLLMSMKQKDTMDCGFFGGLSCRARREIKRILKVPADGFIWWRELWNGYSPVGEEPGDEELADIEGEDWGDVA